MIGSRSELLGELVDGRYLVESYLASGGTSTVYRGLDTRLDRPVAVKVMDARFADDPEFLDRFEREARSIARLSHPGLVAVHDQGSDGGSPFLVMELVEGGTLRELLRERGATGVPMAMAVLQPVLAALAVAHRAGLVHRDVKPENVLVAEDGTVKVADFGLVRAVAAAGCTSSGLILGTAAYLSPEQVTTGDAGPRSDVYSVGILAYELLTGTPPYGGDTALTVAYQHVHHEVPRLSSRVPRIPAAVDEFVATATRRDPSARFPDAAAMLGALTELRRRLAVPTVRVPAPRRSATHPTASQLTAGHGTPDHRDAGHDTALTRPAHGARSATMLEPRPGRGGTVALNQGRSGPTIASDHDTGVGSVGLRPPHTSRNRSRRLALVWLLVVVLLAAAVGIGAWLLGVASVTSVPMVAGLDSATATELLSEAELAPQVRRDFDDDAPADRVLGTDPAAGAELDRGTAVTVLVSAGRPSVPEVAPGSSPDDAAAALRTVGLVPVAGRDGYSATAPVSTVLSMTPPTGTAVPVGSEVAVARSLGVRPVVVPRVVGTAEEAATATLDAAGITVAGVDRVVDLGVDGGTVSGTDPAAGTTVPEGTAVRLRVSTAVTVPGVRGVSVGIARERLAAIGLRLEVSQLIPTDAGLVLTQDPEGSRVAPGSTIRVRALP